MDSALKQRLLGAAVLIALAIIFVPMFLGKSPPKQDNATINQDIPTPPERSFETRTMPVAATATSSALAATTGNVDKIVTADTKAPPRSDARPEDHAKPASVEAPKPTPVKAETSKSGPGQVEAPAPRVSVPPDSAHAGRFAVHLGIYADRGHADALVAKLKKLGYPAYDEATEYQAKSMTRVRVGPFADKAAAETARLKIKQAEPRVPSSVVESSHVATADVPASAVSATRAGGWAVQLGAFKAPTEANKLRDRLRAGGVASFIQRSGSGDATLWKVRAGPYADRAGADAARSSIDQKFRLKGMLVTQP